MVQLGGTFRLRNAGIDSHLHIVISDPSLNPRRIVTANFTTWRPGKDQSCIASPGDHPFLIVESCVDYRRDILISLDQYERCLKSGDIVPHEPVSETLLKRILDGASISPFIPLGNRAILSEQGLIDI